MVQISENYQSYSPPRWIRHTLERLLSSIPEPYTQGLSTIVLADSTAAPKLQKWRGPRRRRKGEMLGAYHRKLNRDPAWIQLVVDPIVKEIPRPLRWLQFARDVAFARVLFHEIGHLSTIPLARLRGQANRPPRHGECGSRGPTFANTIRISVS